MLTTNANAPAEYASVTDFAEYLMDDERDSFTAAELHQLCYYLKARWIEVKAALEAYGFVIAGVSKEQQPRMATDNPHDRWFGPGSSNSHGGSGWEQIAGFAGQVG